MGTVGRADRLTSLVYMIKVRDIEFAHICDEEGNTTLELMLLSLACISSIFSIRRCGC